MLISWKRKFVFIHIPKTGGTTLTRALARYARPKDRLVYVGRATPVVRTALNLAFGGEKLIENATGYHAHTRLSELSHSLERKHLETFFKACFVRNPFSRTYSLYKHIQRNERHPHHGDLVALDFREALDLMITSRWARQVEYLTYPGEQAIAADFIGAFERLEEDGQALFAAIGGAPPRRFERLNANPDGAGDFAELFGDRLDAFVERNRPDFDAFGYSTDPAKAVEPPRITASTPSADRPAV